MYVIFIKEAIVSSVTLACESETLDKIHYTFCMHMYGCELWNITDLDVEKIYVA